MKMLIIELAWMFLEPNITHILNAQTPASQNSTKFLKTILVPA